MADAVFMSGSLPQVVLLSPGAKVALARALAASVERVGGELRGWEADPHAPALQFCKPLLPGGPIESNEEIETLLVALLNEKPRLVVPTRHDDLVHLSRSHERFETAGIALALSSWPCIDICTDKARTHEWLSSRKIPVPEQTRVQDWSSSTLHGRFPLVAKDPLGSGSRSVRLCQSVNDLAALPTHWILQSVAPGREFTVNVYVNRNGKCVCEIPHERLMTGDGEVVRGRTARIEPLMKIAHEIAEALPGARGPLNVQIFWDAPRERATVIEINPRFGGGYPLAHQAGGRFTDWLIDEYVVNKPVERLNEWEANLLMVRYRESAFFPEKR
jgi:carbamoyl-phosphate synthase large subunit